jgi:hypothetical protein
MAAPFVLQPPQEGEVMAQMCYQPPEQEADVEKPPSTLFVSLRLTFEEKARLQCDAAGMA